MIPPLQAHTGMTVYVGGVTAGAVDFATTLGHKLPLFIGVVVLLSALLLMIVFRSLVIPLQAAVMNLLSIGASLGVIVAIFQWGWFGGLFGVQQGPIESFIPVMLFAIVFGLSMDYEVFLISRMHERWVQTGDDQRAVQEGLALTGRVVTAAAAIMVCVFLSFMLGEDRIIKEFGLSLASAVFLDALVIRCLLLPAVLTLVGARTWQIPAWLDRVLPRVNIEGGAISEHRSARARDATAQLAARAARGGHRGSGRLSRLRGGASAALACAALLLIWPAGYASAAGRSPIASPLCGGPLPVPATRPVEQLASVPSLSTGIMSAAQGSYTTAQLLLDITQGSRVSTSAYSPARPPALSLQPRGAGAVVEEWQAVLERAHDAPQVLEPGLLASQIPGGAGYAGIAGGSDCGRSCGSRPTRPDCGVLARVGGHAAGAHRRSERPRAAGRSRPTRRRWRIERAARSERGAARAGARDRRAARARCARQRTAVGGRRRARWRTYDHLAEHQPARPDLRGRSRADDPPPPRPDRSRCDARQADRAGRLLRRRLPALVQSPPAASSTAAGWERWPACSAPGRC